MRARNPSVYSLAALVATTLLLTQFTLAAALPTPQSPRVVAGPDPYTLGAQKALAKAGYVRFGPFPFGAKHSTRDIEELLGSEPLIWIETEHFRLGCALPAVKVSKGEPWRKEWHKSLTQELKQLKRVLPGIKRSPKRLDPWLRAHLFAHRLERLYGDVAGRLGFTSAADGNNKPDGPYLGMREKFTVLLLQQRASHARYTRAHIGFEFGDPLRQHDAEFDCMYWGASIETAEGLFGNDLALHTHLAFNVAHNLYSGYRGYRRALPPWLATGLGHFYARQVSARYPTYDQRKDREDKNNSRFWEWDKRVAGLIKNEAFESIEALVKKPHAADYGIEQHMHCWALVDFLLAKHEKQTMKFAHLAKQSGLSQQQAFEQAFGHGYAELEQGFAQHFGARKKRR